MAPLLRHTSRFLRVDYLSAVGLIESTAGDGDCFYSALLAGLRALNHPSSLSTLTLRQSVVSEMQRNPTRYPPPDPFPRAQFCLCLSPVERRQLPCDYNPTAADYYRYAGTPHMYADKRHRMAFQAIFPDYRVVVWAPLTSVLSTLETTHPELYARHPELPHRGNTWSVLGDPEPLPDWQSHPHQIHLRYNAAHLPHHAAVTAPAITWSHLNHYDRIAHIPNTALLSFAHIRTALQTHETNVGVLSSFPPQILELDSPPTTPARAPLRPTGPQTPLTTASITPDRGGPQLGQAAAPSAPPRVAPVPWTAEPSLPSPAPPPPPDDRWRRDPPD